MGKVNIQTVLFFDCAFSVSNIFDVKFDLVK